MHRQYFKWILALSLVSFFIVAIYMWNASFTNETPVKPILPRIIAPFSSYISASGVVEASSGNILIGSPVNRLADKIAVKVGDKVKEGQILFRLQADDLEADLASRQIAYENSLANLKKLEALPRAEDVSAAKAQLNSSKSELERTKSQYERVEGLQNSGAMSREEISRRRFALLEAEARYQKMQADYDKISAGAWQPDLEIARLQVKQALAAVERVKADLARTIVRAPTAATILQINIHAGEFPPSSQPAMIIGNTDTLHLRVSINQFDASYYNTEAPAVAYLQGNAQIDFPLKFVYIEPYLVAKQNASNNILERVDTRVLQVVYCFEEGENRVFVGQQMDVFIESQPAEKK